MSDVIVQPGQVWADNDARCDGRTLRVLRVEQNTRKGGPVAVCQVLTDAHGVPVAATRTVRIRLSRMRPTSTGYRFLHHVTEENSDA